tara:strand:- start:126 stop:536 length:411 start_codon:yes stop_codon:yes gene_type:complete
MNKKNLLKSTIFVTVIIIGFAIINTNQNIQNNTVMMETSETKKRISDLENQLRCPSCGGIVLNLCELPICREMKKNINEQIQSGMQDKEIINFFKMRYGNEIINETSRVIYIIFSFICLIFTAITALTLRKFKLRN